MSTPDLILGLVNQSQPPGRHQLVSTEVSLSDPILDLTTPQNTAITITALPGSGMKGSVTVYYTRQSMGNVGLPAQHLQETPFTLDGIVAILNQVLLIKVSVDDLMPLVLPTLNIGDIVSIQLVSKLTSMAWIGSFNIELLYGLPANVDDISTIFNTSLVHDTPPPV